MESSNSVYEQTSQGTFPLVRIQELQARFEMRRSPHWQDGLGRLQLHHFGARLPEFRCFSLIVRFLGRGSFVEPRKVLARDAFQLGIEDEARERFPSGVWALHVRHSEAQAR